MTHRQAMAFSVAGDIRFLAHADMLRLFARAAARAGLPVHHSSGFNPHPQISLPLPRSVGMASLAERIVIGLDERIPPEEARARLQAQMPAGIEITRAWELAPGDPCLPIRVAYGVPLPECDGPCTGESPADTEHSPPPAAGPEFTRRGGWRDPPTAVALGAHDSTLADRISTLLAGGEFALERRSPKHRNGKRIDIRPYIDRLEVQRTPPASQVGGAAASAELHMWLRVTPQGTVRPVEVCKALGIPTDAIQHRVLRMEVEWQ